MDIADGTSNTMFYVEFDGMTEALGIVPLRLVAVEEITPGSVPQAGLLLPAVQKVRQAGSNPTAGLLLPAVQKVRPAATDPTATALLLPAVQKVREAARRSLKFEYINTKAYESTSPRGGAVPSTTPSLMPYMEQDNLHKAQSIVRKGGAGAFALMVMDPNHKGVPVLARSASASKLYSRLKLRSGGANFSAELSGALVDVDTANNNAPILLIGFSASRLG